MSAKSKNLVKQKPRAAIVIYLKVSWQVNKRTWIIVWYLLDHLTLENKGITHDVLEVWILHLHVSLDSLLVFDVVYCERVGQASVQKRDDDRHDLVDALEID